jgi:hypothetical protein
MNGTNNAQKGAKHGEKSNKNSVPARGNLT